MQRWLLMVLVVYAPHLLEEHFTGMWNDPLIVRAFSPLAAMPPREAFYLVFQLMLGLALLMTYAFSRGEAGRRIVLAPLGIALLVESHHIVRAVVTHSYNSGLATALPMPVVGAWVLWKTLRGPTPRETLLKRAVQC